jgi:hypothetical protein
MATIFSKPSVQKPLRYAAAYLVFAICALGGILISESLRQNILIITTYFRVSVDTIYILSTWGSYLVYLPYVLSLAIIENYLYVGAKTGKLYPRVKNMVIYEGGFGLASFLTTQLFQYLITL